MKRTLVALVAVVGALTSASAQTSAPHVALPGTERYDLTSKVNGAAYRVYISLPQAYANEPTARYPVVYVTTRSGYSA